MFNDAETLRVLHWQPAKDRWEAIPWEAWAAFRGHEAPSVGLPGISGGVHYFVVCVYDGALPVNIIPHKYLIEADGSMGAANFGGLTREEREDFDRLMIAKTLSPRDEERLNEIRRKAGKVLLPPRESIRALVVALPQLPESGSAAARRLSELIA